MAARKQGDYRAIIGYDYAAEGARKFLEGSEQVQSALRRTETELGDLGPAAAGGVRRLSAEMDRGQNDIETLRRDVLDFRQELERLDDVTIKPVIDVQQRGADPDRVRNSLEAVDRAGSVGSQVLSGLGQGDAANAAGLVGDVFGAFTSLNPVMLATTAVGIGVAAVFGNINAEMEANRIASQEYADRLASNAELIADGATTADITAQADRLRTVIANVDDDIRLLIDLRDRADAADVAGNLSEMENIYDQVSAIFGRPIRDLQTLNTAIDAITQKSSDYTGALLNLNQLLLSGDLAANDAAARAEQQAKDNAAAFDTLVNAGQGVLDLIQRNIDLSLEQAEATRREIVDKQKLLVITEEAAEATRRAAQATAITEATTQLFDVRADLSEKTNDLAEKEAALAKVTADATAKIAQLEADAGERRNEAITKSNDDIEKQEQEHKDRIADIDRKANADIQNAIGRRDALAAFQAAQERKEQITDEVNSNRKRKQELQKSLDDQLNTIRTNLRKQTEAVRTNAANEETIKRQARDASRVALQNAQNAEVLLTKQFYTTQQNSLVTNYQQQLAIHEAGMIKIKDGIVRQYQDALQWGGGKTPSTTSGGSNGKGFVAPYTAANIPALNININGATHQQVVRTTRTQVRNDLGRLVGMLPIQD